MNYYFALIDLRCYTAQWAKIGNLLDTFEKDFPVVLEKTFWSMQVKLYDR